MRCRHRWPSSWPSWKIFRTRALGLRNRRGKYRICTRPPSDLVRLNKALLLLTRLEGEHFLKRVPFDLGAEALRLLQDFSDLLEMKRIHVEVHPGPSLVANLNPDLAAILLSNLIRNAIQHNLSGGTLTLRTGANALILENTGEPLGVPPESLFERFHKGNPTSESTGLGLSIARKICDLSGLDLEYAYREGLHTLTLRTRLQNSIRIGL